MGRRSEGSTVIYAGIGSRSAPSSTLMTATLLARKLAEEGWLLRSGAADGMDAAFEQGCDDNGGRKEIWLPWKGFNGSKSHLILPQTHFIPPDIGEQCDNPKRVRIMEIAASVHPAWNRCNGAARALHARNVLIILGGDLNTPVDRVIAWTPGAQLIGGTASALRLAQQHNIEIVNLANDSPSKNL